MGVIIEDSNLVIIIKPKTIHFGLPNDIGNNLKHESDFITKHNKF